MEQRWVEVRRVANGGLEITVTDPSSQGRLGQGTRQLPLSISLGREDVERFLDADANNRLGLKAEDRLLSEGSVLLASAEIEDIDAVWQIRAPGDLTWLPWEAGALTHSNKVPLVVERGNVIRRTNGVTESVMSEPLEVSDPSVAIINGIPENDFVAVRLRTLTDGLTSLLHDRNIDATEEPLTINHRDWTPRVINKFANRTTILHFIGHGSSSGVQLGAQLLPHSFVASALLQLRPVIVFLHMCYSAHSEGDSLAEILAGQVPVVVAARQEVNVEASLRFAHGFYHPTTVDTELVKRLRAGWLHARSAHGGLAHAGISCFAADPRVKIGPFDPAGILIAASRAFDRQSEEFRSLFDKPYHMPNVSSRDNPSPASLLRPGARVVPLVGYEKYLRKLRQYCDFETRQTERNSDEVDISVGILEGEGGTGKTRLAIEFVEECLALGVQGGFLRSKVLHDGDIDGLIRIVSKNRPDNLLVVVDYAEHEAPVVSELLNRSPDLDAGKVRFLLLVRQSSSTLESLGAKVEEGAFGKQLWDHSRKVSIGALAASRDELFQTCERAFRETLGFNPSDEGDTPGSPGATREKPSGLKPLDVAIEALLPLLDKCRTPQRDSPHPLDQLIDHEIRYWQHALEATDDELEDLRIAAFCAELCGLSQPTSYERFIELVTALRSQAPMNLCFESIAESVWREGRDSGDRLDREARILARRLARLSTSPGLVAPDRVKERFIVSTLCKGAMFDATLRWSNIEELTFVLELLSRYFSDDAVKGTEQYLTMGEALSEAWRDLHVSQNVQDEGYLGALLLLVESRPPVRLADAEALLEPELGYADQLDAYHRSLLALHRLDLLEARDIKPSAQDHDEVAEYLWQSGQRHSPHLTLARDHARSAAEQWHKIERFEAEHLSRELANVCLEEKLIANGSSIAEFEELVDAWEETVNSANQYLAPSNLLVDQFRDELERVVKQYVLAPTGGGDEGTN